MLDEDIEYFPDFPDERFELVFLLHCARYDSAASMHCWNLSSVLSKVVKALSISSESSKFSTYSSLKSRKLVMAFFNDCILKSTCLGSPFSDTCLFTLFISLVTYHILPLRLAFLAKIFAVLMASRSAGNRFTSLCLSG